MLVPVSLQCNDQDDYMLLDVVLRQATTAVASHKVRKTHPANDKPH